MVIGTKKDRTRGGIFTLSSSNRQHCPVRLILAKKCPALLASKLKVRHSFFLYVVLVLLLLMKPKHVPTQLFYTVSVEQSFLI